MIYPELVEASSGLTLEDLVFAIKNTTILRPWLVMGSAAFWESVVGGHGDEEKFSKFYSIEPAEFWTKNGVDEKSLANMRPVECFGRTLRRARSERTLGGSCSGGRVEEWTRPGELPLIRPITGIHYRDGIRFDLTLSLPEFNIGEGVAFTNNGNEFLVAPWGETDPEIWVFMRNVDGTGNPDWRSTRQVSGGEVQDHYYLDMIEIAKSRLSECRVKFYSIPRDRVLDILTGRLVLDMELLPDDARIVNLNSDWRSQSIEFLVCSASYAIVPVGVVPPSEVGIRFFVEPEKPKWIVNDNGELGVMVRGRFFFLYKGDSLEYEDGKHDDGSPILWRLVGKREFGETQWPASWLEAGRREDRYLVELQPGIGVKELSPEGPLDTVEAGA